VTDDVTLVDAGDVSASDDAHADAPSMRTTPRLPNTGTFRNDGASAMLPRPSTPPAPRDASGWGNDAARDARDD